MAEAFPSTELLQGQLECCICLGEFKDPRKLSCGHTYCFGCLEKLGQGRSPGEHMTCSLCRAEFLIPNEGLEGIPRVYLKEELEKGYKEETKTELACEACLAYLEESSDEVPPAIMFCIECDQRLCEDCVRSHKRNKASIQHQLIDSNDKDAIQELKMNLRHSFCGLHDKELIKIYCSDCDVVICANCLLEHHKGHDCSGVEIVSNEFRSKLHESIETLSNYYSRIEAEMFKLQECNRWILDETSALENDVFRRAESMKEIIDHHKNDLLQKIHSKKSGNLKEIETKKDDVGRHLVILQSYKNMAIKVSEKGSAVYVCRNFRKLKTEANEIENNTLDFIDSCSHSVKEDLCSFIPSNFETFLKASENVVGKLTSANVPLILTESRAVETQPHPLSCELSCTDEYTKDDDDKQHPPLEQEPFVRSRSKDTVRLAKKFHIEGEIEVAGVTWFENKIYIVCDRTKAVHVYLDRKPFYELEDERIKVEGLQYPTDICSGLSHPSLFISDWKSRCIWVIQPVSCNAQISRWPVDGEPRRLSISPSDELLIVVRRHDSHFYLIIYSSADFRKSIFMPAEIGWVFGAIQLPESIIISYESKNSPGVYLISALSTDGKRFIRTFDPSVALKQLHDWHPVRLSMDEDGNIFIADQKGSRIVVLNSELSDHEILLNEEDHQIYNPRSIFYLQKYQQLIIGYGSFTGPAVVSVFDLCPYGML